MANKLEIGSQIDINAAFNGGANDTSVTYSVPTSQQGILSVNSSGIVEALAVGTATVEVRDAISGGLIRVFVFRVLSSMEFTVQEYLDSNLNSFTVGILEALSLPTESSLGGVYQDNGFMGQGVMEPAVYSISLNNVPTGTYVIDVEMFYDAVGGIWFWRTLLDGTSNNGGAFYEGVTFGVTTVTVVLQEGGEITMPIGIGFSGTGAAWRGTNTGSGSFPVVVIV